MSASFRLTFLHTWSEREGNYTTLAGAIDAGVECGWSFRVTVHGCIVARWDPIGGLDKGRGTVVLYAEREACDDVPLGLFADLEAAYDYCVAMDGDDDLWLEGYNLCAQSLNGDAWLLVMDAWEPIFKNEV